MNPQLFKLTQIAGRIGLVVALVIILVMGIDSCGLEEKIVEAVVVEARVVESPGHGFEAPENVVALRLSVEGDVREHRVRGLERSFVGGQGSQIWLRVVRGRLTGRLQITGIAPP